MFTSIKTSKENKELVTQLTRKLSLGAENVIARLAFTYSLSLNRKLDPKNIKDAQGKEYNAKVLFGEYLDFYIAMLLVHYGLNKEDKSLAKYVKLHVDDGIELIYNEVSQKSNISGAEFIVDKIEKGIKHLA